MSLRIVLADDHDVVRHGFRSVLERAGFAIVGEAADGREAVRLVDAERPDVVVLDLSMPQLNGVDAGRQIVKLCGERTRVLLLTMHRDEYQIIAALRAGIRGYLLKSDSAEVLIQALREVAAGGTYLSPGICGVVVDAFLTGKEPQPDPLNDRDREVLQLVAEGHTTKEVAEILGISVKSAESYRMRIMDKLDIHDTANLVRYAIRQGMIVP
jgi:DNA-binding NarL/FixJ family response regulator